MAARKIWKKILGGSKNVRFAEMKVLLETLGFTLERVSGSHHIFEHLQVAELVNIQNCKGQVKPYQVRQILRIIELYHMELEDI